MDKDYLTLKRANASRPSGQWRHDDYDVICDGARGRGESCTRPPHRRRGHGGGRSPTAIIEIAPPRLATRRRARRRWRIRKKLAEGKLSSADGAGSREALTAHQI